VHQRADRWRPAAGLLLILAALTALAACWETSSSTSLRPAVLELRLEGTGHPHVAALHLRLDRDGAADVEYWTESTPRLRVQSSPGSEHQILLPRLRAGASYTYLVRTSDPDGREGESRNGHFTTDALPSDLGGLRFDATGEPTSSLVLLVVNNTQTGGFTGYVVVDAEGEVVWHLRVDGPSGITRRSNGNFVFTAARGLVEVTPTGEMVAEALTDAVARRFHHDVISTPEHTLLAIATDTQTVGGTRFTGEAVWEWRPESGDLLKRWSAFDALDPVIDRGPRFDEDNWLHANALWLGERGNLLVSSHYLNQILSIAPDFQGLEWRMGGTNATIRVQDAERFSGQHTVAEVDDGRILLFDNRHEQGGYSRAVEFELVGDEAHRVWEWRPEQDNFASVISSARRRPGGSTLVAFGTSAGLAGASGPIEVYEVSREGAVLWHLEVTGVFALYRAELLTDVAGETEIP
jgi:hypothetical protein